MDTNDIKPNKTSRINVLNKILELGNLTNAQQLYLNYADKLGLDVNWLCENVISTHDNIYRINGLIWKYKYVSLEDDIIKNELLLELEYIKKYISPEKKKELEEIKKQEQEKLKLNNYPLSATMFIPAPINNIYVSSGTSIIDNMVDSHNTILTDEYLFKILDGQVENPKIKDSSEHGIRIVELNTFITCYRFENPEFYMPKTINKPTIRLIIE